MLEKSSVFRHSLSPPEGIASVASRGQKSEKHRLENTVWKAGCPRDARPLPHQMPFSVSFKQQEILGKSFMCLRLSGFTSIPYELFHARRGLQMGSGE